MPRVWPVSGLTSLVQSIVSFAKRTPWWLRLLVGVCFSVVLGYLALRALDWGEIKRAFDELSIGLALLGLGAYLASLFFRALRWRVLFVQEKATLLQLAVTQNVGTGVNNMLPVRVMSEPIQMAMLTGRYKVPGPTALATLATEHMLDIVATAALMGAGVALLPQLRGLSIQLSGALILGVVSLGAFYFIVRGVPTLPLVGKIPAFERWTQAMASLRHERARLVACFVSTVVHWLCLGLSGWFIARGLGLEVNLLALTVMFAAAALFINSVPSAPGAAGTFEFAIIYTLGFFDVARVDAVPFAFLMHAIIFLPPMLVVAMVLSGDGLTQLARRRMPTSLSASVSSQRVQS